jgi:glycosyltransferase involved in cell wall biosynthesis
MKILPRTGKDQDSITVKPVIRVCMHILGTARNDVRVIRAATALAEADFSVSVVDIEEKRNQTFEEEIQGVSVKHVLMPSSFMTTRFTKHALFRMAQAVMLSTLQLLQTSADIYHAHDISGLPACYIAARLRRKILIYDAHELPLAELSNRRFRQMKPLLTWLLTHLVSRCAGVITVSPPIAQEIRNRYRVSNVSLVRNIPPYQAVPKSDRLRQHIGLDSDTRIALYQGNLTAGRGLDLLVHAATFLERNTVIVMMGRGEMEAELKALIVNEGVVDRVKILPPVPYAELLNWTASADIGLMVYSRDFSQNVQMCLPNKLFEYLMAGLPLLASELDAIIDIIKIYGIGRIVSSTTPKDVGEAINAILSDSITYAHMRRNALDASQQDLCWEKERQQLNHFYCRILRNAGKRWM